MAEALTMRRDVAVALLGLAVVVPPTVRFSWQVSAGAFSNSGVQIGVVIYAVIIGVLALLFAPACLLACSARRVLAGHVAVVATSIGLGHVTAAVTAGSGAYFFVYPLSAFLAAALIRRRGAKWPTGVARGTEPCSMR